MNPDADCYLVRLGWGAAWDPSLPRRGQAGWAEHAAFMDALADDPWANGLLTIKERGALDGVAARDSPGARGA